MPNATARGYQVGYIKESTFGTTPSSALKLLRLTQGGSKIAASTVESEELQLAEVPDLIRTSADGTIDLSGEYSYGVLHDFLEGIFGGAWTTNVLTVGSTKIGFTIEEQYTDITKFLPYKGCLIESVKINLQQGNKITWQVMARATTVPSAFAAATAGTGSATAAGTAAMMSPVTSVQLMTEGGSNDLKALGTTAFSIEFSRASIAQPQLGSLSLSGLDPSTFTAKGTVSTYVTGSTQLDKYLGDTATSMALTIGGASASKDNFLFSAVKFADGGIQPLSRGNAAIQTFNWQARYDATNTTCKITRTP